MLILVISIGIFLVLLGVAVFVRVRTDGKFAVQNSDIFVALIPIVMWLFLTGRIQELTFGDFQLVSAVKQAAKAPALKEATQLPISHVRTDVKGSVGDLTRVAAGKPQALSFELGRQGYYDGDVIQMYLTKLTADPTFNYVILRNQDDTLFGMLPSRQLEADFYNGFVNPSDFAKWLNTNNTKKLSTMEGMILKKDAVTPKTSSREALLIMDANKAMALPVVDEKGRINGILERSRLTASMLLSITQET